MFATTIFITFPSNVTLVPSTSPDVIVALFAEYTPSTICFSISIVIVSSSLLYPSGAFVSSIVIVSILSISVIVTVPKLTIPSVPVVLVCSLPFGKVTLNSAPCNFIVGSSLSTFSNCS